MAKEVSEIWVQFRVDSAQSNTALKTISADLKRLGVDAKVATKAMGEVDSSFKMAAGDTTQIVNGINNINSQMEKQISTTERLVQALTKTKTVYKALGNEQKNYSKIADSISGINTRGAAQSNRFNSANMLAQFQDIAVTAQMGMSPLMIAVQQGTQLQYILAQSNAPLKDLAAGFKMLINPISLLVIGITGLTAALIQWVDWSSVASTTLHGLGNVLDFIGDHIITLSAVTLVLIGRFIQLNAVSLQMKAMLLYTIIKRNAVAFWEWAKAATAVKLAMAADWMKTNKTLLIITGTVLALAAAFEWLYKKITGKSALEGLGNTFHNLADKMSSVKADLKDFDKAIEEGWNKLNADRYEQSISKLDIRTQVYERTLHTLSGKLMEVALAENKNINEYEEQIEKIKILANATADFALETEKLKEAEERLNAVMQAGVNWQNALTRVRKNTEDLQFENSIKGLSEYEQVYRRTYRNLMLEHESEIEKLKEKGVKQSASMIDWEKEASEAAKAYAEASVASNKKIEKSINKVADAWDNLQTSSKNKIEDLQRNISLIGAGTYESTYQKTLADMIRQAESGGVNLTPDKYEQLQKDAEGIAELTEEYETLTDKVDFAKSSVKGFFSDMRQGLKDGESAWEAFGNAVSNVLDKILDKMMDIGVDALFNAGYSYFGTENMGGVKTGNAPIPTARPTVKAAQGGVFTNGVYSSPTMFKFAKGGKFGVMGEAGPEAVMPLTRNSDGTLGVKATNVGNSSPVVVNVINNSNAQARVEQRETSNGTEIDVMIDQLVAEKMGKPGTSSNSALRAFNNQKLIAR